MNYKNKMISVAVIIIFIIVNSSCEWPFNTTPTESDVFVLEIAHDITRLMPNAEINLTWNEITVENFSNYIIERRRLKDTTWTKIIELKNPFQLSYIDTIWDDDDLKYRVGIVDIDGNILWANESISIPKTTSLFVPSEFSTIQPAYNSEIVDSGDTIIVNPGIYQETISIAGKDVLIKSRNGYKNTILLPTTDNRVVNISAGIIDGFTIEQGAPSHGAAGGGIKIAQTGTIQNCYITGNISNYGGGVFLTNDGNLYNNIIYDNSGGTGSGIYITAAHGKIINNTIVKNDIVINADCSGLIIRNNIIYQSQPDISFTNADFQTGVIIDYNLFDANINYGTNFIHADPQLIDYVDFKLQTTSPCINAGHPGSQYDDKDGSRNDLGAYGGPRARF